ncbi:MAG: OmpA family protein [Geminicoccaceae bacterium]
MHRIMLGVSSTLAILAVVAGGPTTSIAHDQDELCNTLVDGDGDAIKEADGDFVGHSDSSPCQGAGNAATETYNGDAKADNGDAKADDVSKVVAIAPAVVAPEPLVVYFDSNQDSLSASSEAEVQAFASLLTASDPKGLKVVGHTDTSGSAELNEKLSKARADQVASTLVDAGVSVDLISFGASGEGNLAVETPDNTREANNRRVTITPVY